MCFRKHAPSSRFSEVPHAIRLGSAAEISGFPTGRNFYSCERPGYNKSPSLGQSSLMHLSLYTFYGHAWIGPSFSPPVRAGVQEQP